MNVPALTGKRQMLVRNAEIGFSAPYNRIYRVDSGNLILITSDGSGMEVPLRHLAPGEFFGEFCFCPEGDAPHNYLAARATEPSHLTEFRASAFMRFIQTSPQALEGFIGSVCRQLASSERRIFALTHRGAEERLCLVLLELSARDSAGSEITASHSEIADFAAMSRSHISLTLGRLRRIGFISYRRQGPITLHRIRIQRFLDQNL
jgi:CRP-like cAMP-binding protein